MGYGLPAVVGAENAPKPIKMGNKFVYVEQEGM
jgi:hypothetical protein